MLIWTLKQEVPMQSFLAPIRTPHLRSPILKIFLRPQQSKCSCCGDCSMDIKAENFFTCMGSHIICIYRVGSLRVLEGLEAQIIFPILYVCMYIGIDTLTCMC